MDRNRWPGRRESHILVSLFFLAFNPNQENENDLVSSWVPIFLCLGSVFRWKVTLINVKNAFLIEASDDVNVPSCFACRHHYGFHGYAATNKKIH